MAENVQYLNKHDICFLDFLQKNDLQNMVHLLILGARSRDLQLQ